MAGYVIYSLDWAKLTSLVERPTRKQLMTLANLLADGLEELEGEFEEDDVILDWPPDAKSLMPIVAQRLALPDWYSDLSSAGKTLWEGVIFNACLDHEELDLGFRADSDGVYWDVLEILWKLLGVRPSKPSNVALAAFGTRAYRMYSPDAEWAPMHSMHSPDEVERMRVELESVRAAMMASKNADEREQFEAELMPAIKRIAEEKRMLFVQVDT